MNSMVAGKSESGLQFSKSLNPSFPRNPHYIYHAMMIASGTSPKSRAPAWKEQLRLLRKSKYKGASSTSTEPTSQPVQPEAIEEVDGEISNERTVGQPTLPRTKPPLNCLTRKPRKISPAAAAALRRFASGKQLNENACPVLPSSSNITTDGNSEREGNGGSTVARSDPAPSSDMANTEDAANDPFNASAFKTPPRPRVRGHLGTGSSGRHNVRSLHLRTGGSDALDDELLEAAAFTPGLPRTAVGLFFGQGLHIRVLLRFCFVFSLSHFTLANATTKKGERPRRRPCRSWKRKQRDETLSLLSFCVAAKKVPTAAKAPAAAWRR